MGSRRPENRPASDLRARVKQVRRDVREAELRGARCPELCFAVIAAQLLDPCFEITRRARRRGRLTPRQQRDRRRIHRAQSPPDDV